MQKGMVGILNRNWQKSSECCRYIKAETAEHSSLVSSADDKLFEPISRNSDLVLHNLLRYLTMVKIGSLASSGKALILINIVTLRWAWLVPGWWPSSGG